MNGGNAHDLIIRPLLTEKSTALRTGHHKYCFAVRTYANRVNVKWAVEKILDVKVKSVNILNVSGKVKRMGRFSGKRPDWKKAIVTLHPGEKIGFFEA